MNGKVAIYGPLHPRLGNIAFRIFSRLLKRHAERKKFYTYTSSYAQERISSMQEKLRKGECVYLLGLGSGFHNSGIALIEVSPTTGLRLLANHEEERFSATKHCAHYPQLAIETLLTQMSELNIEVSAIHACLATFDVTRIIPQAMRTFFDELPASLAALKPEAAALMKQSNNNIVDAKAIFAARQLGQQLGLQKPFSIIGMRHHDNHAYFSYAVSPFRNDPDPVMTVVIDSFGDDSSISLYTGKSGHLEFIRSNKSLVDSLGVLYSTLSSTQGGWPILSSEGRYMGAAAWGNMNRLTNPYYMRLRQLIYCASGGEVYLNRTLARWHFRGVVEPYSRELIDILGHPIPITDMWHPDAILDVENIQHPEITQERVDKAAAVQLLFEDVIFHIVGHFIQTTGSHKLIFAGGCALNCIANMRLLQHFDGAYYERYLGQKNTCLHLWIPPTPGDTGVTMGAAYAFALANGAKVGQSLQHAFYCGLAPTSSEIREAVDADTDIAYLLLGNIQNTSHREKIADLLAFIIAKNGIMGVFQGIAETGPRALGHRSILANPCNPYTRDHLNTHVKFRELIRPLAPMLTQAAASSLFELAEGASDDDYNAYNYMVLTAYAKPESFTRIPAVIHKDGTSRIQIVREETDPFIYTYLKAMGRRVGVEVSVNTSLNVGSPIVQTPAQALHTLKRSKGLDGLLLIGDDGQCFIVWHTISSPPKDTGERLCSWLQAWQKETQFLLVL